MKYLPRLLLLLSLKLSAQPILPDVNKTPGDVMTNIPIETVLAHGYTPTVRNVPESVKREIFIDYFGYVPTNHGDYEIDHLISLELGGSNSRFNLWPESYVTQPLNAHTKDKVENRMASILRKSLALQGHDATARLMKQFQIEISTNWIVAYEKYYVSNTVPFVVTNKTKITH